MAANIPRYLIENHGPDIEGIKTAFAGAFQVCQQAGITQITLIVPAKGTFPDTVVGSFLGSAASKALCNGQSVRISDTISMNLESVKTFSLHGTYGMVIGIYLSEKDHQVLDSIRRASAIVLLPWTEDEGKAWMATWSPTVLGASTWCVPTGGLPKEVEDALLVLTRGINLSTGLSHPSDKESAKRTLTAIRKAGHRPDADEIRRWAVRHDWAPREADDLAKLAARIIK